MTFSNPQLIWVSDDQVVVKRGVRELLVSGAEAASIATLVVERVNEFPPTDDWSADIPEPTRAAAQRLRLALEVRGLVDDHRAARPSGPEQPIDQDAFFSALDQDPTAVRHKLAALTLTVIGINALSRYVVASLASMGMASARVLAHPKLDEAAVVQSWTDELDSHPIVGDDWRSAIEGGTTPGDLVLSTSGLGGTRALLDVNRRAVSAGLPFLPVWLDARDGFIGPLTIARESGCLRCWFDQSNATGGGATEAESTTSPDPSTALPLAGPAAALCGPIAAMEILKFSTGCAPSGVVGRAVRVNSATGQLTSRRVLKMPRCPDCSEVVGHRVPSVMNGPQIPDR